LAGGGTTSAGGASVTGGSSATETTGGTAAAGGNIQSAGDRSLRAARAEREAARALERPPPVAPRPQAGRARREAARNPEESQVERYPPEAEQVASSPRGTLAGTVADAGTTGGATSFGERQNCQRRIHGLGWNHWKRRGDSNRRCDHACGWRTDRGCRQLPLFSIGPTKGTIPAGVLQPSGLSSSDSYATVKAKSDAILSGFQTVLNANAIRIPINEFTIVTNPTWWTRTRRYSIRPSPRT